VSALIIPVALLVGVTVGALGGGGSILTVPVLVYLFGQDARAATTGSLIIVGTTTLIGMLPHLRQGRVRLAQGAVFGVLGVAGAILGSKLAVLVPPEVLLAAFSVLMFVVAALMTRRRRAVARAEAAGARPAEPDRRPILTLRPWHVDGPRLALLLATATGVGMLTGFFGVGGGFAVVPALVLVLGMPMPVAVGTSLVVITINSASSLVSRLGQDVTLDWGVIGWFTVLAVVGSLLGSLITTRVRPARLSLAFTVLLVGVAVYTAARSIPALV
jgi:uncharacterized membrane protein YfcA